MRSPEPTQHLTQRIRSGLSGLAFLRVAALAFSTVASIIVARALGPSAFGQLAVVLALAAILAIPSNNTIIPLLLRYTSSYDRPEQYSDLGGMWQWSRQRSRQWMLAGMAAILLAAAVFAVLGIWPETELYAIAALLIPCWAVAAHTAGTLQGLRRVVLAQLFDWLLQPALYLACIIALALSGRLTIETVLVSVVGATAISASFGFLTTRWQKQTRSSPTISRLKQYRWQASWRTYLYIQAVNVANLKMPLLLIGVLSSQDEAGSYRAGESIATLLALVMAVANGVLGPYISRMYEQMQIEELQALLQKTARLLFLLCLPAVSLLLLYGNVFIRLIYGAEYGNAYLPMLILILGQFINVACGSVGLMLNMTGHERHASRSLAWAFATSFCLCLILVPGFGATGAAIAVTAGMIQWNVVQLLLGLRHLGINPSIFARFGTKPGHPSA